MQFPTSGVETFPLIPFAVAFGVSAVTSMGGVSGAFVLLPFQVSVLGFSSPAVTPTNHLFNVVAIPAGVYRYMREGRMLWPLAWIIILGTVPGVVVGSLARIYLLPEPSRFKLFMGLVLAYIGSRLLRKVVQKAPKTKNAGTPKRLEIVTTRFDPQVLRYTYEDRSYEVSVPKLALLTTVIGVVGGAYGVGGGAILAPFLVTVWKLPVHTVAGATLLGTCLTSVVGVAFFTIAGPLLGTGGGTDWLLGLLFGAGGVCGMYTGARLQRFVPAKIIESLLALVVLGLAIKYVAGWLST